MESMPGEGSSHQGSAVTHLHRDINRRIVDANSVVKVLNIVEAASQDFNPVNISTAFHRLARMWRDLPDPNGSSNGQTRLDTALHTLMQLAVRHIKQVGTLLHPCIMPMRSVTGAGGNRGDMQMGVAGEWGKGHGVASLCHSQQCIC